MKVTDPIRNPASEWTKQGIHDQLDTKRISPEDISDADALWWVVREDDIRFDAISNGEDFYGRCVGNINKELIKRTLKGKK